jgi:hypothetical protein
MNIKVFDRIEKKYLITKKQKQHILAVIKKHMQKDEYFESRVFNTYLDTDNFDLIIQSIEQPIFKEKVRARSYGGYDNVYIELKTKLCGKENNVGYKRRICISKRDYGKFLKGSLTLVDAVSKKAKSSRDIQIAKELDYLVAHFNLKPQILVFYERQSYQGEQNLRITFDEHLKYRTKNINFNTDKLDKEYFKDDKNIILEIKAHGYLPLWLVQALSQEKIFPQQFSKVGKIYQTIRKETNV